ACASVKARTSTASTPRRVLGNRPSERLTFSPSANLTPRGASARSSLLAGSPYRILMTASLPPRTLALPWRSRAVATPPARAREGGGVFSRARMLMVAGAESWGTDGELALIPPAAERKVAVRVDNSGHDVHARHVQHGHVRGGGHVLAHLGDFAVQHQQIAFH